MNKKLGETWKENALLQTQEVAPYYMEYMKEAVICTLEGKYSLRELASMGQQVYENIVVEESNKKDAMYSRGDLGRPGIMDGGPNEKELFYPEAQKCRKILQGYGFPKISDL